MMLINIVIGLIGLGIVVFVHELGHFLAARLVGVGVDAFSIGWGNPILKKKIGSVEYRLGMFPIGGYCKMRGETDYNVAWNNMQNNIKPEKGTYLAASPLARMLIAFAGPFFNLIFAVIILSIIWGAGREINTFTNRITLYSEVISNTKNERSFPADRAGLKTGDRIIQINGRPVNYFHEIHEIVVLNARSSLVMTIDRDGEIHSLNVTPSLVRKSGAGRIGITNFDSLPIQYRTPVLSVPAAITKGFTESLKTLAVSLRSLRLLFMGIDLTQAVSGPVRITYMIGDMATSGFSRSFATGLRSTFEFIALISIVLCMMNLLPLPIIDGGMIILFFVELIRRKPIPPKAVSIFQGFGMVIIFGLLILAIFGDILFFFR
ncbi:MAG: site-2 protease family protein [Treponema sp.]|jgi:regulator of sigma E protease|nr:site-2 protease family protein [Treponema sp.]